MKAEEKQDCTEEDQTTIALRESESRYRLLVEMMNEGLARADGNYVFSYVNGRFADMLGYAPKEMIGHSILDFVHPDDQEIMREQIGRREKGQAQRYEVAWRSKDDRKVYTLISPKAVFDDKGDFEGSVAVLTDITDRKVAEQALQFRLEFEAIIMSISTQFINLPAEEIDDGIGSALRTIGEFTGVDRAYVFRFYDEGASMDNTHEWCAEGVETQIQRLKSLRVDSFPWFAERIRRLEAVYVPLVADLPPEAAAEKKEWQLEGTQSLICVPMVHRGSLIGFLGFDAIRLQKWWPDDNIALLKMVGNILVNALQRKSTEEALKESEERYRSLVELSPDMITVTMDGKIAYANPAAARLVGSEKPEDLVGRSPLDLIQPDYRDVVKERMRLMIEEGKTVPMIEEQFLRMDGTSIDVEVAAMPVTYRGKPSILAVMRDITARKKAEEALRRSEANFRAIFDYMPAAIFGYDKDGIILQANEECERLFEFKREALAGRSLFETISTPKDHEKRRIAIARVFSGETVEGLEWEDRRADGSTIYVLSNATPVYDTSGRITMGLSLSIDITERKLAEQRRRELEAHKRDFYRRTIQAATEGKLLISEKEDIERIAGPAIGTWGIGRGEDLGAIRQAVTELAEKAGMDEDSIYDFRLAVGEATTNAYKHAGGGMGSLHNLPDGLLFLVSDKGPGIEALTLPEVALVRGYSTAGSLGMGYKAILSIADKVYLSTGPSGTTVAIAMRLHPAPRPVAAALLPDTWTS